MNRNFDEILNEKFDLFKSEKNTLGGEDLKIVNDAIHYMKYIKSYSDAIKTGEPWVDPNKKQKPKIETQNKPQTQDKAANTREYGETDSMHEAVLPKPKNTDDLRKGIFTRDKSIGLIKLLNSAVIKYQELYQKMYQLIGKYSQLQKVYGAYSNNNQMYANMFDCPTWEERKGLGKFASDEQILENLLKFKENLEKVIKTTQSDEKADLESDNPEIIQSLLKDPMISQKYRADDLKTFLKNLTSAGLTLESMNEEEELDLTNKKDKQIQALKSLLISYSDSEERMQKLLDPANAPKIKAHIDSKMNATTPEVAQTDSESTALSKLKAALLGTGDKISVVKNLLADLENEIKVSTPVTKESPSAKRRGAIPGTDIGSEDV